jgi:xanthine/uracil permease
MTSPPGKRPSPARGLAAGLILSVVLFPFARHLLFSTVGVLLGIIGGAFIAVFIYAVATTPRR